MLAPENCSLVLTRDKEQTPGTSRIELKEKLGDNHALNLLNALSGKRVVGELRDRILTRLDGHPLAITWAGGLLSLENEDVSRFVEDWEKDPTLSLNDPENARHTLKWLFERSVHGLDELTRSILAAAGLLASDAFSVRAIEAAFGDDNSNVRDAIKRLIDRGMLRLAEVDGHREFAHVLAYQFARGETNAEDSVRKRLAQWLFDHTRESIAGQAVRKEDLQRALQHSSALLRADPNQVLWKPLGYFVMYDGHDRLIEVGRLEWVRVILASVSDWLRGKVEEDSQPSWQREYSVSLNKLGSLAIAEGNLPEARRLFSDGLAVRERLAESDPGNATWQRDLSLSHERLGDLAIAEGNLPEARRLFSDGLAVRERLAESDPGNATWQRDLSLSHERLGDLAIAEGNLPEARRLFSDGLAVRERLAESDPGNATWQRDLSVSLDERLGDRARWRRGIFLDAARAALQPSVGHAVRERLAANRTRATRTWQRDLSVSLNERLGDRARWRRGIFLDAARAALQPWRWTSERSLAANQTRATRTWQRDLSVSLQQAWGTCEVAAGNLPGRRAGGSSTKRWTCRTRASGGESDPSNAHLAT